jgi:hypothetical protein
MNQSNTNSDHHPPLGVPTDPAEEPAVEALIQELLLQASQPQERVFITAPVPASLDRAARLAATLLGVSRAEIVRRALFAFLSTTQPPAP